MNTRRADDVSRRRFLQTTSIGMAAAALGFPAIVSAGQTRRKLIMLGMDGMDPRLLKRYVAQGIMPNAARLIERGHFGPLATSNPPQSPVAWASVISGTNPGGHGLFDFITRDAATLAPRFSMAHTEESSAALRLGSLQLPLAKSKLINQRHGHTFWQILQEQGIDCVILRMPANFPPTASDAHTLSGMGTPDIHGSYGIFTLFTDARGTSSHNVPGGRIERIAVRKGKAHCVLPGPVNSFRTDGRSVDLPFTVHVDGERGAARIRIQDVDIVLNEGEWSDWIHLKFKMLPMVAKVRGICRFYLQRVRGGFSLYVTPVNMDPAKAALPISTPEHYARTLAHEIGPFYTQSMPQDTSARQAGVFNDEEYRTHAVHVLNEEIKLYRHELERFREGCLFAYFSSIDLNCHLFWRAIDAQHPVYTPALAKAHGDFIPWLYQQMDEVIGDALKKADADTSLVVMSDHGFGSFRRQFNLNRWLMESGFSVVDEQGHRGQSSFFANVDWARTSAYGLGLNGLYVNVRGREPQGSVEPGDAFDKSLSKLQAELLAVRDPANNSPVISRVFRPADIYSGPYLDQAPDLIVGYHAGYRASWDTVLGKFSEGIVLDNLDPWSGDHANDPQFVPGVLLTNHPVSSPTPHLEDLAPSILGTFGLKVPEEMTGNNLFKS